MEDWDKPDIKHITDQQVELSEELLPTLAESKAAVRQSILDMFNPRELLHISSICGIMI